jgi:ABC-type phosphate transport system auxiliary subunit
VTAKLSRQFYERFGDELTNELVNWMNMVDTAYRSDFRELFEVHFGRFDAKLEQRVAQLDATVARRLTELDDKVDRRTAQLEARLDRHAAQVEAKLERMKVEILGWNILMWIGTLGTVVALLKL